jgi:hypothetical protein
MRFSIHILFGLLSFVAVFSIGLFFSLQFWQAGIHFEENFSGKPLPKITKVFVSNLWFSNLLLSLPWFALVGIPLAAPTEDTGFRSQASFVMRYLAFLSIEALLVFFLIVALLMPFISYYAVMRSAETKLVDLIPAGCLALAGSLLLVAIIRLAHSRRRNGD